MNKLFNSIWNYIKNTDKLLWLITVAISVYSLILINSMQRAGEYSFMKSQVIAVVLGYIGAVVLSLIDYRLLLKYWWISAVLAVVFAISVFLFGIQVTGTDDTAWIKLPFGITFQPSELIKILFIITFSAHMSYLEEKEKITSLFGVVTLALHVLIPVTMIHMQGDDGAVLIFVFMFIIMTFIAGVQLRYFAAALATTIVSVPIIWNLFLNDEHRNRIMALFDLDGNALTDYAWQQYQGKVSIASGQLSGQGLGNGMRVEMSIVPEQENDFIFTVAGEELGFIGCTLVLALLLLLSIKIVFAAQKANDKAGAYICYGMFAIVSVQSIINIGMVLGFLPVVGITLPFFSAGGTSAMCLYLGIGLVQSVYMHSITEDPNALVAAPNSRVWI